MPKVSESFNLSEYALVADRISSFYERYPTGRIITWLVSRDRDVTFKAAVYRNADDARPAATGWASEREGDGEINLYACLENTETSAIGRALANLGFTASRKRPSREEMEKVDRARRQPVIHRAIRHEPAPAGVRSEVKPALDPDAAAATADLRELLREAQDRGFPKRQAEEITAVLEQSGIRDPGRIERLEAQLRRWIREHQM
jgi:hypothetical protein